MNRILIIQTAFIGDVILATPIAEAIHEKYPNSRIDFLVRKGNEALFKDHPFLNQILVWDKRQRKYAGLFKLLKQIRDNKYDLVVNCQRFAASGFLAAFSKGKSITGFDKNPFSRLFNYRVSHEIGNGLHETERNLRLIEHLGGVNTHTKPKLYPGTLRIITQKPYVCIAPASVWFTKQWPEHKWVELIRELPLEMNIYLIGSQQDTDLCNKIINVAGRTRVENLCGKIGLLESAELMKLAEMNYVNDSAPMHLCSAVNAPVTAIFCSTIPDFGFGPLSEKMHIVESPENLKCRPCGLHGYNACPEGHFHCAEKIRVEKVI